jgi:hypothetical protein
MLWQQAKTFVVIDKQKDKHQPPGCACLKQPSHKQQRIFTKRCAC